MAAATASAAAGPVRPFADVKCECSDLTPLCKQHDSGGSFVTYYDYYASSTDWWGVTVKEEYDPDTAVLDRKYTDALKQYKGDTGKFVLETATAAHRPIATLLRASYSRRATCIRASVHSGRWQNQAATPAD
ncbi:MAG: hypothetical protein M1389_04520 [Chloroflexi bacterium]|nr:hypothetical protein [Chloroflexota bacterium]